MAYLEATLSFLGFFGYGLSYLFTSVTFLCLATFVSVLNNGHLASKDGSEGDTQFDGTVLEHRFGDKA